MFEGLRAHFDKMGTLGAEYERRWIARDEHQRAFMQQKGSYLDGLATHVFGTEPKDQQNSAAGKIFRRAAYVADSAFAKTPMRTVV